MIQSYEVAFCGDFLKITKMLTHTQCASDLTHFDGGMNEWFWFYIMPVKWSSKCGEMSEIEREELAHHLNFHLIWVDEPSNGEKWNWQWVLLLECVCVCACSHRPIYSIHNNVWWWQKLFSSKWKPSPLIKCDGLSLKCLSKWNRIHW